MSVSADGSPRYALIAFATAWGPQHGGINAFNVDLLEAVAAAFWERAESVCVVLDASEDEVQRAYISHRITLVPLGLDSETRMPATLEPQAWAALTARLRHLCVGEHIVWLGHDRITGPIALEAQRRRGGKSVVIHHMSYERYEAFAEGSQAAETKRSEQIVLFRNAQHIFAVGPLLMDALSDLANRSDGHLLIPGLADIEPRQEPPKGFKVFLSGRLSAETRKIKQAHLGLAGFGHAVALCDGNSGYPDALRGEREPGLRLRGVDFEHEAGLDSQDAESDLRAFVESHAQRVLPLSLLPFTQDRQTLFRELRQSSVALMPSWHEGFGLVAWEAIAAGVPLVVSRKSGVYRLLEEQGVSELVLSIDPKGSNMQPFFRDEDRDEVAMKLIEVAKAPEDWRRKAAMLRQRLQDDYTWRRCAEALIAGLGWQVQRPTPPVTVTTKPASASVPPSAAAAPTTCLLETPGPRWQPGQGLALSQLLRAEERVVPFDTAHSPFLEKQLHWATGTDTPRLLVRLLTGRGGTGKTRLALELCRQLQGQGWETGLLPSRTGAMDAATALATLGRPSLVVVDYAETRQQQVLNLLKYLQEKPGPASPVRLLLLARAGGDWWAQFPSQCAVCEALLLGTATSGPYDLPPLHQAVANRLPAYRTALLHFADRLQLPMPQAQPDLSAERFAHPLYLQMTALLALHGEAPSTAEALTRALLAHEKRYWAQAASHLGLEEQRAAATLMALSTLCGGFAVRRDAEAAWQQMGLARPWLGALWTVLQPLYPEAQGLDGLRPDLLGEALVAQALLASDQSACLDAVLGTGSAAQRRHALTVLARVLRTRDDVASSIQAALQRHFARCALEVCDVGLATPSPLTDLAIAAFEALSEPQRAQAAGVLQPRLQEDELPLTRLAVAVDRSEKDRAETKWKRGQTAESRLNLVSRLHSLSVSHRRNGQDAVALAASQEAFDLCLSVNSGVIGLNEREWLARVLGHHATLLSKFGRYDEAISMSERALSLHRQLRASDAERFESDLADSLGSHASRLADRGRHDEALRLSKDALDLHRKLAERLPKRFESDLAVSLSNHAVHLAYRGQHEEALKLSKDALNLRRKLAERLPERFEPDLAASLNNHAIRLADQGQHEEALKLSKDALDLHCKLAERLPERFEPDLAASLSNQANRLAGQGQHEEALRLSKDALDLRRRLAERLPERFEPDLTASLNNHAVHLAYRGQHEEALKLSKDALDLRRKLAERYPERFEPDLAASLNNHTIRLADQGQREEALKLSKDALDLYRKLAERYPERFEPDLAASLNNHAIRLADQGQHEEALRLSKDALDLYRKLAERYPERFAPDLATGLHSQTLHLAANGQWSASLDACNEAATRLRAFAQYQAHVHGQLLGHVLLWAEFLGWISTGLVPGKRTDITAICLAERGFKSVGFWHAALGLLFAAPITDCDLRSEAHTCLQTWSALDCDQQADSEGAMLVVSAVLHTRRLPPLEAGWQERWRGFVGQRQGHIPQWILVAVERTGAALPEF